MGAKRDFKGVWIPKEIWLSADLSVVEKCLFVEINSLDNEHGCYASNKHFAKFLGISDHQVSRLIKKLEEKGYIKSKTHVITKGDAQAFERIIRVKGKYARSSDKGLIITEDDKGNAIVRRVDRG